MDFLSDFWASDDPATSVFSMADWLRHVYIASRSSDKFVPGKVGECYLEDIAAF